MMNILIVGASGATGRLLTRQLLDRGHALRIIVRNPEDLPEDFQSRENLSVIPGSLLDFSEPELIRHTAGCDAVASCLGHNISFRGIYGKPRRLVADAVRRLCSAVKANNPEAPVKYVLMNTAGNRNPDLPEPRGIAETCVIGLIRLLLPPHRDNELAAEYLRSEIGRRDGAVQWAVVRPDDLIDQPEVSPYEVHPSPLTSAIFRPRQTSRINVAHFMADLLTEPDIWNAWKGQMPVQYNKE